MRLSDIELDLPFELPEVIEVPLAEVSESLKEGVLAFCVALGLRSLQGIFEVEVEYLAGPRGKHDPEREAFRHGTANGSVVLGGRKVRISRPRVRSRDARRSYRFRHMSYVRKRIS